MQRKVHPILQCCFVVYELVNLQFLYRRSAADGASSPNCDVDTLVWLHNNVDLVNPRSLPSKGVVNINFRKDRTNSKRRSSKFSVSKIVNFNHYP